MCDGYVRLRNALLAIVGISDREWRQRPTDPLDGAYVFWNRELLEKQLPVDDNRLEIPVPSMKRRLLVLPPTSTSVSGLLAVDWDFGLDGRDSRKRTDRSNAASSGSGGRTFRVFLIPPQAATSVTPTVIRFDEMEDSKSWCFAHAQLCDIMTPYGDHFAELDPACWISATLPRIPLAANRGPEPILVCLLASLYGVDSPLLKTVLQALNDRASHRVAKQLGWTG